MDRLVRKDFMAGENIRSAGEGFTAASAAYLNSLKKMGGFQAPFKYGNLRLFSLFPPQILLHHLTISFGSQ